MNAHINITRRTESSSTVFSPKRKEKRQTETDNEQKPKKYKRNEKFLNFIYLLIYLIL